MADVWRNSMMAKSSISTKFHQSHDLFRCFQRYFATCFQTWIHSCCFEGHPLSSRLLSLPALLLLICVFLTLFIASTHSVFNTLLQHKKSCGLIIFIFAQTNTVVGHHQGHYPFISATYPRFLITASLLDPKLFWEQWQGTMKMPWLQNSWNLFLNQVP